MFFGLFIIFCALGWSRIGDCPEEPEKDWWYWTAGVLMVLVGTVFVVLLIVVALASVWAVLDIWAALGGPVPW